MKREPAPSLFPAPALACDPSVGATSMSMPTNTGGTGSLEGGGENAGTADASAAAPAVTYIPVAAIEAIIAERHRQIFTFGHTPETDRALDLGQWAKWLGRDLHAIIEGVHCGQDRTVVRRRLVKFTAQAAAMIERLDYEIEQWAKPLQSEDPA